MAAIHESVSVSEATSVGDNRYKVLIISEGAGSTGYYSAETLQDAADRRVIPANTHSYFDHPKAGDLAERSLRDLAGAFVTDAVWDDELRGLVAELKVFQPFRDVIGEMKESIGLSILGDGDVKDGVVQRLTRVDSVDFVTKAGRGGRVLQLMESARSVSEAGDESQFDHLFSSSMRESSTSAGDEFDYLFTFTAQATR